MNYKPVCIIILGQPANVNQRIFIDYKFIQLKLDVSWGFFKTKLIFCWYIKINK